MAERTVRLLEAFDGRQASINGATQIRAGVMRPEIIIALEGAAEDGEARVVDGAAGADGIRAGDEVRIIREPWFGRMGRVRRLSPEPVRIETEATVRVLEVELAGGETLTVPRANVEVVEK
jgi:hypothetical protein